MTTDAFDDKPLPDTIQPIHTTSTAQEMARDGWVFRRKEQCPKCGAHIQRMDSPSGTPVLVNGDGSVHLFCQDRDPEPPVMPPVPDQEEYVRKMKEEK